MFTGLEICRVAWLWRVMLWKQYVPPASVTLPALWLSVVSTPVLGS